MKPSFDKDLMIEACAGGLTLWGVPRELGRKIMAERLNKMTDHNTCPHCHGTGKIPLTGIYAETLNNRLRKLEEHGHVFSERYGAQRRFYLCVTKGKP